jgi:(p)ppGpp synthase/HD superfamily hydrolase
MNIRQKAQDFATKAHANAGQVRKFTGEPYIVHPAAVVELLQAIDPSDEMIAAAWLHDVVEDTDVTLMDIQNEFGTVVAQYIEMLTDSQTRSSGGERIHRKNTNLLHTSQACPEAQSIKLCDLIDNASMVVERDPIFARQYLLEMKRLLLVLTKGDTTLHQRASHIYEKGVSLLCLQQGNEPWFERSWEEYEAHLPIKSVISA